MGRTSAFFNRLRSRPHHERVILAGVTYVSLAAVVIAISIASLKSALRSIEPQAPPAALPTGQGSIPQTPPGASTEPELATPLDTLGGAFRDVRGAFQNLKAAFQKLRELTSIPLSEPGGQSYPRGRESREPRAAPPPPSPANPTPVGETEIAEWLSAFARVVGYNVSLLQGWLADFIRYWTR